MRSMARVSFFRKASGRPPNFSAMASHSSPRTTKLYARTNDQVTLDEVEKIVI